METSARYIKWKQQRSRTRVLANILILLAGVENQCISVTTIYYYHESFKYSFIDAGFYFAITESIYSVSTGLIGMIFGRYVDSTRNMRFVFLLNLVVLAFGNLMYSIPYHIWWVIVGRFLCGVNESLQTTICGKCLSFDITIQ